MAAPFETAIAMDFCVTPSEFEMPRSVVLNSRSPIDFVSCTGNDLILHLFIQIIKILAITGDPDDQILIFLRLSFCRLQCLGIYKIELELHAIVPKESLI